MRIATSTTYSQQAAAIDNLEAQYQAEGQQLSTGKSLNGPSDNPEQIGTDLNVHLTIATETQATVNIQAATAQLTSADTSLANLTSLLQSTNALGVQAADDLVTPSTRKNIAGQVDQFLQQAIGIANTQYGGTYIFSGSTQATAPPVTATGSPATAVTFDGNEQEQAPLQVDGQSFALTPTLQQAFNYNATNGSPSVFDTLINLRDTLTSGSVTDQSAQAVNHAGDVIYGAASPAPVRTTLGASPSPFAVAPVADSKGNYTFTINNVDAAGKSHTNTLTFNAATVIDDTSATSVTGEINALNSGPNATGLTATFDARTQRLVLSNAGGGAISVSDGTSAGATGTSNLTNVFALTGSATLATTISTQLGDISNVLNTTLNARAEIGTRINALAQINTTVNTDIVNNTSVISGIEDTDVAKVTTQFTATEAALTASYSTTNRLEAKDLFDYIS